jgi:hypothetical protein
MSALIRPVTSGEVSGTAAIRFREQYSHWNAEDTFHDGRTKASVDHAFNTMAHTPENITEALNKGWAYPECNACGKTYHAVIRFKAEWATDSYDLCSACLAIAETMLAPIPHGEVA